jgi:hypothetical protein
MTDITQAIKELGYPITVSIWLMWFVSAVVVTRLQRLLEWALAVKHQLDHIELMLQQITGATHTPRKEDENA